MSDYRDDTQETAVASDETWAGIRSIAEDSARVVGTLMFGLMVMHTDAAVAADEVFDRTYSVTVEQAVAADEVLHQKHSADVAADSFRIGEQWRHRLRVLHEDEAEAADVVFDLSRSLIVEQAQASDEVLAQRYATTLVVETTKAIDFSGQFTGDVIEEAAEAADLFTDRLRARVLLADAAEIADEVLDGRQSPAGAPVVETATARDAVIDHLAASVLVEEVAVAGDTALGTLPVPGQAWTANVDSWAMSRYLPYTFRGLAVIDGVAYGMAEDGVYALSGGQEAIEGELRTGKLDIGKGALVHPLAAFLEYELAGTDKDAQMDVTTTQSGQPQTYTYTLPAETADHLTNGRFVFGRGLRGRHFSFALRLSGEHGYLNDLSVQAAPTKRRV